MGFRREQSLTTLWRKGTTGFKLSVGLFVGLSAFFGRGGVVTDMGLASLKDLSTWWFPQLCEREKWSMSFSCFWEVLTPFWLKLLRSRRAHVRSRWLLEGKQCVPLFFLKVILIESWWHACILAGRLPLGKQCQLTAGRPSVPAAQFPNWGGSSCTS